jgi:DNA-binding FadR family transcriptional regulator
VYLIFAEIITLGSNENLITLFSYLCRYAAENGKIPSITEMSDELGMSVATLREQLEVTRALGIIESRPRKGIRLLPYSFKHAVVQSVTYAMAIDDSNFQYYSDLRIQIENAYWYRAVCMLEEKDHNALLEILEKANQKLNGDPVQIPHIEHRDLHLSIYKRLDNPFVTGILEAYWDLYESIGLAVYTDLDYLSRVWSYHRRMVDSIISGEYWIGQKLLLEHMDLLYKRIESKSIHQFE